MIIIAVEPFGKDVLYTDVKSSDPIKQRGGKCVNNLVMNGLIDGTVQAKDFFSAVNLSLLTGDGVALKDILWIAVSVDKNIAFRGDSRDNPDLKYTKLVSEYYGVDAPEINFLAETNDVRIPIIESVISSYSGLPVVHEEEKLEVDDLEDDNGNISDILALITGHDDTQHHDDNGPNAFPAESHSPEFGNSSWNDPGGDYNAYHDNGDNT